MRKVSLEMNLGKKSQARFPKRIQSNIKLKLVAPACEAKSLPPLGSAISVYGVDAKSFCEDFNYMSIDYETGFLVSLNLWITQTKSYYYSFRYPSCFNLFHKCFDFYEGKDLNMKAKMLLLCCMNIALIKNVENESIFLDKFIKNLKQILGSLRSYGFFIKKVKNNKAKSNFLRKKDYIKNTKFNRKKK